MVEPKMASEEECCAKVSELQALLDAVKTEKDSMETLNFPWAGNLGNWYWYIKTNRVLFNEQKIKALGYSKEDIPDPIGFEFFTEKIYPEDYEHVMNSMRDHLYGRAAVYETTYRIKTQGEQWLWFYDRGKITKHDEDGKPELIMGIVFDITEQKKMEEQLAQQNEKLIEMSTTDALTNLFNRRTLFEKLDYEMRRASRTKNRLSILILDIDYFKKINDTHGHVAGDKILFQVAEIIN